MPVKYHCGSCNYRLPDPSVDHCPHCRADLHAVGRCKESQRRHLGIGIVTGAIVAGSAIGVLLIWLMFR
jgi:hypothetical protein